MRGYADMRIRGMEQKVWVGGMVGKEEVRAVETREEQNVCVAMNTIKDEWKDK